MFFAVQDNWEMTEGSRRQFRRPVTSAAYFQYFPADLARPCLVNTHYNHNKLV